MYETDSRGFCVKNGPHCAFAHGPHDLRAPVYDIRELTGEGEEDKLISPLVGSLEREKGVLVDDPRWHGKAFTCVWPVNSAISTQHIFSINVRSAIKYL